MRPTRNRVKKRRSPRTLEAKRPALGECTTILLATEASGQICKNGMNDRKRHSSMQQIEDAALESSGCSMITVAVFLFSLTNSQPNPSSDFLLIVHVSFVGSWSVILF